MYRLPRCVAERVKARSQILVDRYPGTEAFRVDSDRLTRSIGERRRRRNPCPMSLKQKIQDIGWPYEVVGEALNGELAIAKITEVKPDLLLTDIKMPMMDGIEGRKSQRTHSKQPGNDDQRNRRTIRI